MDMLSCMMALPLPQSAVLRAVARVLFQPRQRGEPQVWGRSPQRGPGQNPWSGGHGRSPFEAESFLVVGYPKEMENLL